MMLAEHGISVSTSPSVAYLKLKYGGSYALQRGVNNAICP